MKSGQSISIGAYLGFQLPLALIAEWVHTLCMISHNKKLLIQGVVVLFLVLSFGAKPASAAFGPFRSPFDRIWDAIHALQDQIGSGWAGATGATGAAGVPGTTGATGPAGSLGAFTTYVRTTDVTIPSQVTFGGITGGFATCDSGDKLLSGGAGLNMDGARILASYPFGTGDWYAGAANADPVDKMLTVFALCADITP